jgi:hypothetical protein
MNVGPNTQGERVRVRVGPREARGAKALYSYGKGYQNLNQSQHVAICSLEALHCFQLKFARLQDLLSIVQLLPLTLMIRTTGRRVISIRLRMISENVSDKGELSQSSLPAGSSRLKYEPLDPERPSIRLAILHPGPAGSTIRITLAPAAFIERPRYEALSYTVLRPQSLIPSGADKM